jgi:hypothetical protein
MSEHIEADANLVNPVRRDKLTRLGDKLDAAEKRGADNWVTLYFEYEPLAIKLALETKPPKISIRTTAEFWQADAMTTALYRRMKAIEADIENNSGGTRRMRTSADLKASLAVTKRDWMIVAAAVRKYQDKEKRKRNAKRYQQRTALKIGRAIQDEIRRRAAP